MTDNVNSIGVSQDDDQLNDPADEPSGALSAVVGSQADKANRVNTGRQAMSDLRSQYVQTQGQANDAYAAQKKALDDATQRLLAMQTGPTDQEAAYRVAAAVGTGDREGRFNPAGISGTKADILQQKREAELAKQQLISQYGMQMPQAQLGAANARLSQLTAQERIQQSENNQAATQADKPAKQMGKYFMQNPNDPSGPPVFNQQMYDADIGAANAKAKNVASLRVATQNAMAGNLDPATLDRLAANWNETGKLDSGLTRGGPAIALKIYKRGQELADANGDTAQSLLAGQAYRKAQSANLTNVTKQYGAFKGFENTMVGVANNAMALSDKVDRTPSNLANHVFQWADRTLSSPEDLSNFDLVNNTLVSEYAKIMSGSMGNTPVAEGIAKAAHSKLMTAMANGTYKSVARQMINEGQIRNKGLVDNINDIKAELGAKPAAAQAPAAPATGAAASSPVHANPLVDYYIKLSAWKAAGSKGPAPVAPK